MSLAPIVLFVYNRPWHTRQVVESLQKNILAKDSLLFIFSDGPRNQDDEDKVFEVREYLKNIIGFKTIKIVEREKNYGLSQSIISGVSEIVDKFGEIIVLEDDLVTSSYFLNYMNDALNIYKNDERVISIHGYVYPVKESLPETFFIRGADCWGWATWKKGWDLFEADGKKLLADLERQKIAKEFDFNGGYPYTQMLKMQIKKLNNSWAIRWYASAFLKDRLTLYPGRSLIKNIGLDNAGYHRSSFKDFTGELNMESPVKVDLLPAKENLLARRVIEGYFKRPKMRIKIKLMEIRNYFRLFCRSS